MTSTPTVCALQLQPHQVLHLAFDAGTTLQVTGGALVLRTPMRWIGETLITPSLRLAEGEGHRLEAGGWCVLEAVAEGVELLQHVPPARWSWVARWLRRAAGSSKLAL